MKLIKINRIFAFSLIFYTFVCQTAYAEPMALVSENQLQDSAGRMVFVEKPFSRIISLYPAHTENLFFLGMEKEIIGVSRGDDYPDGVENKTRYSVHDGPEKFLAAKPDLILVRPMIDHGYAPLIKRLEQFGIAVVSLQPSDVDEMFVYWQILGRLTGKESQARDMVEYFRKSVDKIHSLVEGIEEKNRKKVYFEAVHSKMKTFSPGSMPVFALKTAGGINVASGANSVRGTNIAYFGKERILSLAEQIDVYLAQQGAMNNSTKEMIQKEPGFSVIKAVREDKIYLVDEKLVSRPTMRLLWGIVMIGEILYPDIFNDDAGKCYRVRPERSLHISPGHRPGKGYKEK
jgi:iron complex transport system substrate-binding protein